jgi:hypothetical protein
VSATTAALPTVVAEPELAMAPGGAMADAADDLDVNAMLQRFRERADAVKDRPLPPVAGAERQRFIEQAELDYMDFAIVADATWTFEEGILKLQVDLRPQDS